MPKLRVIKKSLYYGGREVRVGEGFVATPVDAAHLKKRGQAEDYVEIAPIGEVGTTSAAPAPVETEPSPAPRRIHNRRLSTDV